MEGSSVTTHWEADRGAEGLRDVEEHPKSHEMVGGGLSTRLKFLKISSGYVTCIPRSLSQHMRDMCTCVGWGHIKLLIYQLWLSPAEDTACDRLGAHPCGMGSREDLARYQREHEHPRVRFP